MKIKKMLVTCLAGIMLVSVMALPASAAEIQPLSNTDSVFSFQVKTWPEEGYIDNNRRVKENDTGIYVWFKSGTAYQAKFRAYGSTDAVPYPTDAMRGYSLPRANKSTGPFRMRNVVYEQFSNNGKQVCYAHIGANSDGYAGTCTGVWSPDSVGNDPYLN